MVEETLVAFCAPLGALLPNEDRAPLPRYASLQHSSSMADLLDRVVRSLLRSPSTTQVWEVAVAILYCCCRGHSFRFCLCCSIIQVLFIIRKITPLIYNTTPRTHFRDCFLDNEESANAERCVYGNGSTSCSQKSPFLVYVPPLGWRKSAQKSA